MYTLVKTLVLPTLLSAQWQEVDAGNLLVKDLFHDNRQVVIEVTHPDVTESLIISLDSLREIFSNYNNTLNVLLQVIEGQYELTFLNALPNKNVSYLQYNHAMAAGYHIKLGKAGVVLPEGAPVDQKTDIVLTRPGVDTDYQKIYDYCLASVNGFIHDLDSDGNQIYIKNGGRSTQVALDNQVGIYSFLKMGKIKRIPIPINTITNGYGDVALSQSLQFSIPSEYHTLDKPYLLVLGGYLVLPQEGVFWRTSEGGYNLCIECLNLVDRYLESREKIDLSSLGLTSIETNLDAVSLEELYSEEVIKRYMTLSQSFLILIDTDNLFHDRVALRQFQAPGLFTSYQEPKYPLILGTGRVAEYWKQREGDRWAVTVTDSFKRMYMHHRERMENYPTTSDQLSFNNPYYFSQGFLLEIGSYKNQE